MRQSAVSPTEMPSEDSERTFNASVPPSTMPLVSPNALLHAHLKQQPPQRPSNRAPSEPRPIQLNTGSLAHCNGSSLVKVGTTTIVCGVRAEILPVAEIPSFRVRKTSPTDNPAASVRQGADDQEEEYSAIPLHHLLVPNIELATGCSPRHPANTAPSVEAQSISQRLLSLLHSSQLVRTSDLEIIHVPPPEAQDQELGINGDPELKGYWTLYIDMVCISHGGSIFDAAWLALYAALRDSLIPKAWWDADLEQIVCSANPEDSRRLKLRGMPVPSSFGVFIPEKRLLDDKSTAKDQLWVLTDVDGFEEESCAETGCLSVDRSGRSRSLSILGIEKSGGSFVGIDQIMDLAAVAERRWKQWKTVLENALAYT